MSAAKVSRTGLPFSQLSATASISAFFSITSAMALSTAARSVADASPQASLAACAASRASSTSSGVDSATSVIGPAVAGVRSTRYLPCVGAIHLPPMKFSYLGATETMLPGWPGGTYFMSLLLQGSKNCGREMLWSWAPGGLPAQVPTSTQRPRTGCVNGGRARRPVAGARDGGDLLPQYWGGGSRMSFDWRSGGTRRAERAAWDPSCRLGGRPTSAGDRSPARLRAQTADSEQQGRSAVR